MVHDTSIWCWPIQHHVCLHFPCAWWPSFSLKFRLCFLILLWVTRGVDVYTLLVLHIQLKKLWCPYGAYPNKVLHLYTATMLWMNILLHFWSIIIAVSRLLSSAFYECSFKFSVSFVLNTHLLCIPFIVNGKPTIFHVRGYLYSSFNADFHFTLSVLKVLLPQLWDHHFLAFYAWSDSMITHI